MLDSEAIRFLLRQDPILYVDAGARGDLEGDWGHFPPGCLSVLAFEPDPSAPIDWENSDASRHLERSALWSHETEVDIHIGQVPSTSSVWPPDLEYLARFASGHVDPRRTVATAKVRARPLDAILKQRGLRADFLKVDTQGAELQILQGAQDALDQSIIGAVVETWTAPVHRGQGLTQDIMALMYERGFVVCQIETAAAWNRKIAESNDVSGRRQIVGLDILFMRDPVSIRDRFCSATYAAKFAVIAQMYGHHDLGMEALAAGIQMASGATAPLEAAMRDLRRANDTRPTHDDAWTRLRDRFLRRTPRLQSGTKLHY